MPRVLPLARRAARTPDPPRAADGPRPLSTARSPPRSTARAQPELAVRASPTRATRPLGRRASTIGTEKARSTCEADPLAGTSNPSGEVGPSSRPEAASQPRAEVTVPGAGPKRPRKPPGPRNRWYCAEPGVDTSCAYPARAAPSRGFNETTRSTSLLAAVGPTTRAPGGSVCWLPGSGVVGDVAAVAAVGAAPAPAGGAAPKPTVAPPSNSATGRARARREHRLRASLPAHPPRFIGPVSRRDHRHFDRLRSPFPVCPLL